MKIRPVEAELLHVDGRIDMTKGTVALRSFLDGPEMTLTYLLSYLLT